MPRIRCANHLLNWVVRGAIVLQPTVCGHLFKINQFVSKNKNGYNFSRIFKHLKCRLRLHNLTRWGSQYLCLESVFKVFFILNYKLNKFITYYLIYA